MLFCAFEVEVTVVVVDDDDDAVVADFRFFRSRTTGSRSGDGLSSGLNRKTVNHQSVRCFLSSQNNLR